MNNNFVLNGELCLISFIVITQNVLCTFFKIVLYFRPVKCGYSKIGCPWRGPSHEALEHEKLCPHPSASGKDVMSALDAMDLKFQEEKLLYDTIFDLMSFEKITFNGNY